MKSRVFAVLLGLVFAQSATVAEAQTDARPVGEPGSSRMVFIGTRGTGAAPGAVVTERTTPAHGIYSVTFDASTGRLSLPVLRAPLERSQYLIADPARPVLYSVADSGGGLEANSDVHAYAADPTSGALRLINKTGAGGSDATYLSLDRTSNTLFVANHNSGSVSALPVRIDGGLGTVVATQKTYGDGPHPVQDRPQAHSVAIDPSHRFVVAADLGADRVFVYRFDPATRTLAPASTAFVATSPASGPRHLMFHPGGEFLYLNTQLDAGLLVYGWDDRTGRLSLAQTLSLYPLGYSGTEAKSAADIAISRDGRFLYVSLRGDQDSIVAFAVDQAAGTLKEIQRLASGGDSPRSVTLDPTGRWMLVTNDVSNSVTVFSVDPVAGRLIATGQSLSLPAPSTVAFLGD